MPATVEIKFRVSSTGARGPIESPIVNIPAVSEDPENIYASTTPSREIYGQGYRSPSAEQSPWGDPYGMGSPVTPGMFPDPMIFQPGQGAPNVYPDMPFQFPQYPNDGDDWGLDLPNFPVPPPSVPVPPIPAPPYTPPGVARGHISQTVVPNTIIHGQNFQIKTIFRNVGYTEGQFKVSTSIPALNIDNVLSEQSVNLRPGEEGTVAATIQMTDIVCITTPCPTGGPFRGTLTGTQTVLHLVPATAQWQSDDSKNWNYDGGGVAPYPVPPTPIPHPPGPQIPPIVVAPVVSTGGGGATASAGGGTTATAGGGGATATAGGVTATAGGYGGARLTAGQIRAAAVHNANLMRQRLMAQRNSALDLARQKRMSRLEGIQNRISVSTGRQLGGSMSVSRRTYTFPFEKGWVF